MESSSLGPESGRDGAVALAALHRSPTWQGVREAVYVTARTSATVCDLKYVAPKHVLLTQIFGGCLPFLYIVIACMVVVYVFPQAVLWPPQTLYK